MCQDVRGTEYGEEITIYVYIVRALSFSLKYIELGSSDEPHVASTDDGNEVIGLEAGRVWDISDVADQETTTIPAIKTEPNASCVPVVTVTYISYRLYPELPALISVCLCETDI
jgi:hypothetical protein